MAGYETLATKVSGEEEGTSSTAERAGGGKVVRSAGSSINEDSVATIAIAGTYARSTQDVGSRLLLLALCKPEIHASRGFRSCVELKVDRRSQVPLVEVQQSLVVLPAMIVLMPILRHFSAVVASGKAREVVYSV